MDLDDMLRRWLMSESSSHTSVSTSRSEHVKSSKQSKKLHFQLVNCMDINEDSNQVSFMALPANVILNIPIVASVAAEAPFTKDSSYFQVEVLSTHPDLCYSTLVLGAVQSGFAADQEPGSVDLSVGFRPGSGRVSEDGVEVKSVASGSRSGDKFGCGIETQDDDLQYIYFTKNGNRVFEMPLDPTVEWFPAFSLSEPKDAVKLLEDFPWRSSKLPVDPHEGLKLCHDTGHLSFKSNRQDSLRKESLMLASQQMDQQFAFFEIEIIAMGERDEISIGIVPENYPSCLPGLKAQSVGFLARSGGIYAGRKKRNGKAPKCQVGDKIGCGMEHRVTGKRKVYFTHNSKEILSAEVNSFIPDKMFPAIGLSTKGTGTVCVCIADPSLWLSPTDNLFTKYIQVDMQTSVDAEPGTMLVDKETARATFAAPTGSVTDAILVANTPLTTDQCHFEIEILYGNMMTFGLVPANGQGVKKHPGFTSTSIGYNAESGQVYVGGNSMKDIGKSTYGDRVRCGVRTDANGQQLIFFKKNGKLLCEIPFQLVPLGQLYPTVAVRSGGQPLALRLVDRKMWGCETGEEPSSTSESKNLSEIERELIECAICRDVLTDPRILPCSIHTFCAECIKSYAAQNGAKQSMPCPICRNMFTMPLGGVDSLPVNTTVSRLLEQFGIGKQDSLK